jgi:hypothetical protein
MPGHYLGETNRELELKKKYSRLAVESGARVSYIYNMPWSAQVILQRILAKVPVTLKIQRELIEEGRESRWTAAGEELGRIEVEELRRELELEEADELRRCIAEMRSGEKVMREEIDARDKEFRRVQDESEMRWKEVGLLKERIAEMVRYTEKMEREVQVYRQALEEQGRIANRIGETTQSKFVEDQNPNQDRSGEPPSTCTFLHFEFFWSVPCGTVRLPSSSAGLPLDQSSLDFGDRINKVLHGQEYEQCTQDFKKEDSVWLVDYLDRVCCHVLFSRRSPLNPAQALDNLDPSCPASRKCIRELRSICGTQTILPTSHLISPDLLSVDSHPFTSGGFGEVYRGTLDDTAVCVKRLLVQVWAIPFATMMEVRY